MTVLLDTNVILDVLLQRGQWLEEAQPILEAADAGEVTCCLPASTLTDIFYIARRCIGWSAARDVIRQCLHDLVVLPVTSGLMQQAYHRPEQDFEDSVIIAIALHHGLDAIVTRDDGLSSTEIEILSPTDLCARLA